MKSRVATSLFTCRLFTALIVLRNVVAGQTAHLRRGAYLARPLAPLVHALPQRRGTFEGNKKRIAFPREGHALSRATRFAPLLSAALRAVEDRTELRLSGCALSARPLFVALATFTSWSPFRRGRFGCHQAPQVFEIAASSGSDLEREFTIFRIF